MKTERVCQYNGNSQKWTLGTATRKVDDGPAGKDQKEDDEKRKFDGLSPESTRLRLSSKEGLPHRRSHQLRTPSPKKKLDHNGIPIPLQLLLTVLTQNKQFL